MMYFTRYMGAGIAQRLRYGLDGPGIESRWGAKFSAPVQTVPGTLPSLLCNRYRVFLWGKAAGGVVLNIHPSTEVMKG